MLSDLADCGYPAIALDLRGHGESPLGNPADFNAMTLAADVLDAVRAAGINKYVLVGHSMGGRIAMRVAALEAASWQERCEKDVIRVSLLRAVVIEDMAVSPG